MELVDCTSQDRPEVVISLHARTAFGHELSCIKAKFISDMTPCAPAGGFGLSAPTGDARLVAVAMDWHDREYSTHTGGVTAFLSDEAQYYFQGGTSYLGTVTEQWRFVVSRVSGTGKLTLKGQPPAAYVCHTARQKF